MYIKSIARIENPDHVWSEDIELSTGAKQALAEAAELGLQVRIERRSDRRLPGGPIVGNAELDYEPLCCWWEDQQLYMVCWR